MERLLFIITQLIKPNWVSKTQLIVYNRLLFTQGNKLGIIQSWNFQILGKSKFSFSTRNRCMEQMRFCTQHSTYRKNYRGVNFLKNKSAVNYCMCTMCYSATYTLLLRVPGGRHQLSPAPSKIELGLISRWTSIEESLPSQYIKECHLSHQLHCDTY